MKKILQCILKLIINSDADTLSSTMDETICSYTTYARYYAVYYIINVFKHTLYIK